MNQISSCKKIVCFQCGSLNMHDAEFCDQCRFDISSELSERQTSCMYLRLAAIAFSLGTLVPLLTLFVIGELGARELPALGVGVIVMAIAGCAWIWAQQIAPQYVIEPVTDDLRSVASKSRSRTTDRSDTLDR